MNRAEKDAELELLGGYFAKSQIALCADYRGLSVDEITALRRAMREAGSTGRVVKNTLARFSAKKSFADSSEEEVGKFIDLLSGPSFLIFAEEDPIGPAKVMAKFAKEHDDFEIKGGWFEGAYLDKSGVVELSKLPSREETLAKLLSVLMAPATKLVQMLNAPGQQLVQVLEGHRKNLEEKE